MCVCARACARARVCMRVGTRRREAAARAENGPASRSFSPAQNSGGLAGSRPAPALPGTQLASVLKWKPNPGGDPAGCGMGQGLEGAAPEGQHRRRGRRRCRESGEEGETAPASPGGREASEVVCGARERAGEGRGRDEVCLNASSLKFSASVVISSLNAYLCHAEIGFIINSWSHPQRLKGPRRFVH